MISTDTHFLYISLGSRRPFGVKVRKDFTYQRGFVLDSEENREVEFKSFAGAPSSHLPWKIMEKAKKFICACLNGDRKGVIYFGVEDNQREGSKFRHGEIAELDVEDIKDDITKAFQDLLNNHIKSDGGPLQKGGEQNCVNLYFVPVKSKGDKVNPYVIEIEYSRDWRFCKDNVYHSKRWIEKKATDEKKDANGKKGLHDLFKVKGDELDDVAIRTNGASACVKQDEVRWQVREPLKTKFDGWKRETSGKCSVTAHTYYNSQMKGEGGARKEMKIT